MVAGGVRVGTVARHAVLRGEDVTIAPALEQLAEDRLARAASIVDGGVDHVAARI